MSWPSQILLDYILSVTQSGVWSTAGISEVYSQYVINTTNNNEQWVIAYKYGIYLLTCNVMHVAHT